MGHPWAGDRYDGEEVVQPCEVVRVDGEEGKVLGHGDGSDHQVGHPAAWLAAGADHCGTDAAVDARRFGIEGDRVELVLGALQDVESAGAFGVSAVAALFVAAATDLCGPADNSARVIAVIAISSGSSSGATQRRRIMMLVSRMPCWYVERPAVIGVVRVGVGRGLLIGPEPVEVDAGRGPGHRGEFLAGDEPTAPTQRDEPADRMSVTGDGDRLTALYGIRDLSGPAA